MIAFMGNDAQISSYKLSEKEQRMIAMHNAERPLSDIAKEVFGGRLTRQGVHVKLRAVKRKLWRWTANERYSNPGDVPVKECPIPARTRHALIKSGYITLGSLAGMTEREISDLHGVGPQGGVIVAELLHRWNVKGESANLFCPNCGKALGVKKTGRELKRTCEHCGAHIEVKVKAA
jgi:hypothetical protein